jgi:hypothetical protein
MRLHASLSMPSGSVERKSSLRGVRLPSANPNHNPARNRNRLIVLPLHTAAAYSVRIKASFDHEKLDVYQESIRFVSWGDELIRSTSPSRVHEDSADYSTSRSESNSND